MEGDALFVVDDLDAAYLPRRGRVPEPPTAGRTKLRDQLACWGHSASGKLRRATDRITHRSRFARASLPEVQAKLGHGNISTTSGYLHARPDSSSGLRLDEGVFLR